MCKPFILSIQKDSHNTLIFFILVLFLMDRLFYMIYQRHKGELMVSQ